MLEELLIYVSQNDRVCPLPRRWTELWEMLPDRHRAGGGWAPGLPIILGAWWDTPILVKVLRLREHIEYADEHGVLSKIDAFLRALPETEWAHTADFVRPPE